MVVAFALDRAYPDTSMINNFLRTDFNVPATVVFDHHKGPHRVPEGKGLATAILREEASRSMFGLLDETVFHKVLAEIDTVFPGLSNQVLFGRVYRWDYGAAQLPPGALARKVELRRELAERLGKVFVASDSLFGTSLEGCFLTGAMAAQQAAGCLGG
jgi:protoporphyrinogen oxidase